MAFSLLPQKSAKLEMAQSNNAILALKDFVAHDLEAVNRDILSKMESPVQLIPQLAGHLIASGGKRLRPMLTLGAAALIGYKGNRHVGLAACIEFIHTATLLHDDVVDNSDLRRGKETANALWGNAASVLVGDFLFSRSFELMVEDGSLDVLKSLSKASATISEGEILQMQIVGDVTTSEETYLTVIQAKTAALFAASCEVAALVASASTQERNALYSYGNYLGIAFQIADDALDYTADQASLGKAIGDDFREGKLTLPVIRAYAKSSEDERIFWKRVMAGRKQQQNDLDKAIEIMKKYAALEQTEQAAKEYAEKAKSALDIFPDTDMKNILKGVADFAIERSH